ncbi:MAG TPA: serine hydrolase [Patescibacteria group bacterium]
MYNEVYTYRSRRQKGKKKIRFFLLLFFIFVIALSYFILSSRPKITDVTSPLGNSVPTNTPTPLPKNSPGLTSAVENALSGSHGSYGIVIKNLSTGESYYQNEKKIFESGSLYKLWVMAVVFEKIHDGNLNESDILQKDASDLYKEFDVEPDGTEQSDGTISMNVDDALYQMITISSNNAALLLTDNISIPAISNFLKLYNFSSSKVGTGDSPPITDALDISELFEKLYKGQLADSIYTEKMITLLKGQRLNDKIPKYLPDDVIVAHKTGELDTFTHDAGIIYSGAGDYIIVVLSESDDPNQAKERIALISQNVYDYFTSTITSTPSSEN